MSDATNPVYLKTEHERAVQMLRRQGIFSELRTKFGENVSFERDNDGHPSTIAFTYADRAWVVSTSNKPLKVHCRALNELKWTDMTATFSCSDLAYEHQRAIAIILRSGVANTGPTGPRLSQSTIDYGKHVRLITLPNSGARAIAFNYADLTWFVTTEETQLAVFHLGIAVSIFDIEHVANNAILHDVTGIVERELQRKQEQQLDKETEITVATINAEKTALARLKDNHSEASSRLKAKAGIIAVRALILRTLKGQTSPHAQTVHAILSTQYGEPFVALVLAILLPLSKQLPVAKKHAVLIDKLSDELAVQVETEVGVELLRMAGTWLDPLLDEVMSLLFGGETDASE